MNATFSMRLARVREGGKTVEREVEWVEVSGLHAGDVVSRRARPADRDRFKTAYQAFRAAVSPPKMVDPIIESAIVANQRRNNEALAKVFGKRKG